MQVKDKDDLCIGYRSKQVKCGIATNTGQKFH